MRETEARAIVRQRSGGQCEMAVPGVCQGRAAGVHHRVKRSQGGAWSPSNLIDACGSGTTGCHGWAESHPSQAHEEGLSLLRGDDPQEVSAHIRWVNERSWWFLLEDGTVLWDESDFEPLQYAPDIQMMLSPGTSFPR